MDYSLFKGINGLSGSAVPDDIFRFIAERFPIVLGLLVAFLFLVPWRGHQEQRRRGAVFGTAAAAIALLINQPISHAVGRLRPYVVHPATTHLLIARSHDASFPSDHATGGFALACGMLLYDRVAGTVLFLLAALLAFARVYVGTHYPGDVVGGAGIGIAVALLLSLPPVRGQLERFASASSQLWDRLLARRLRRPRISA